jgi:hypothetical protein
MEERILIFLKFLFASLHVNLSSGNKVMGVREKAWGHERERGKCEWRV